MGPMRMLDNIAVVINARVEPVTIFAVWSVVEKRKTPLNLGASHKLISYEYFRHRRTNLHTNSTALLYLWKKRNMDEHTLTAFG